MKSFGMLLVVLGVCVGALGASGFHRPDDGGPATREDHALTFFVFGAVALGVGGYLVRVSRRIAVGDGSERGQHGVYREELGRIQAIVAGLDEGRASLDAEEIRSRVGDLLAQEYFDLTSKSDDFAQLVGFNTFAAVWDGVAVAERLLARCWSMCTDGHAEEGLAELPLARAALDRAVAEMAKV
jgi:hypothetical protein